MDEGNRSRATQSLLRDGDEWSDAACWDSRHYRRESFFFPSGEDRLYGSLYAATEGVRPFGVVVCPSWGMEGRILLEWCHQLALGVADAGGTGLVVQWPGSQDSSGDPQSVTLESLVTATRDAVTAGKERCPDRRWALVGVRIGAAAASVAATTLDTPYLMLVQPELDPAAYFDEVERDGHRAHLDGELPPNWAFGHALPPAMRGVGTGDQVQAALAAFRGKGTVVRYKTPRATPPPDGMETVVVPGDWDRPPLPDHRPLRLTALRRLRRASRRGFD